MLSHQLLISQFLGLDDPSHGVTEDLRVVTVVESPFQFLKITVHMLETHLVEGTDDGAFEQAPHALDPLGVNVTDHPLLGGVTDGLMPSVGIPDSDIGLQFIGVNGLSLVPNVSADEIVQGMAADVGDSFDSDLSGIALDGSGERVVAHGLADAVGEIPGCTIGSDAELPMELTGRDTFLGFAHEINRQKPLAKRQVGIVHDGSRCYGEVVLTPPAVPLASVFDLSHAQVTATGAGHAVRPSQGFQVIEAGILGIETIQKGDDIHGSDS